MPIRWKSARSFTVAITFAWILERSRGDGEGRQTQSAGVPGCPGDAKALYTGDYGYADEEGSCTFVGRRDAQLKSMGVRVSPIEVEEILYASGMVEEVAVVGKAHELLGDEMLGMVRTEARGSGGGHRLPVDSLQPERDVTVHDTSVDITAKRDAQDDNRQDRLSGNQDRRRATVTRGEPDGTRRPRDVHGHVQRHRHSRFPAKWHHVVPPAPQRSSENLLPSRDQRSAAHEHNEETSSQHRRGRGWPSGISSTRVLDSLRGLATGFFREITTPRQTSLGGEDGIRHFHIDAIEALLENDADTSASVATVWIRCAQSRNCAMRSIATFPESTPIFASTPPLSKRLPTPGPM